MRHFQFNGWHRGRNSLGETEDVPTTPVDDEDEDEGMYEDHLTSEGWQNLFGDTDDEEFAGFE